jgi:hypothetical protein
MHIRSRAFEYFDVIGRCGPKHRSNGATGDDEHHRSSLPRTAVQQPTGGPVSLPNIDLHYRRIALLSARSGQGVGIRRMIA